MIPTELSPSHDAHRRARHDDGERARIERLARETAVRDGSIRVPVEAAPQGEVDRFRSLLTGRNGETRTTDIRQPDARADEGDVPAASGQDNANVPVRDALLERVRSWQGKADGKENGRATTHEDGIGSKGDTPDSAQAPVEAPRERASDGLTRGAGATASRDDSAASSKTDSASADSGDAVDDTGALPLRNERANAHAGAPHAARSDRDEAAAVAAATRGVREFSGIDSDKDTQAIDSVSAPTQISAEAASFVQAQRLAFDAPQQAAMASSPTLAPALAELIEKHVKQMMVSDARSSRLRSREVLLRMQDDVMPGTDLWLTRTTNGWQLRADVRSRDAYDELVASSEELIQRFADGALGELTIEPMFHGEGGTGKPQAPEANPA